MNGILQRYSVYRLLAVCMGVLLLAALLVYIFVLGPRDERIRASRKDLQDLYQRVRSREYPMDRKALEKILQTMEAIRKGTGGRPGIEQVNRQLLAQAEQNYLDRIRKRYGTRKDFIQRVTRLDFQEEYFSVMAAFRKMGLQPDPGMLGLSEKTPSDYTYQLMLRLWTLDMLRQCIASSGVSVHTVRRSGRQVPELTLLPMIPYLESKRSREPFLLEFPVRVTVSGNFAGIRRLLVQMMTAPYFLPVRHFEIYSLPETAKSGEDQLLLKMECAGYFIWNHLED